MGAGRLGRWLRSTMGAEPMGRAGVSRFEKKGWLAVEIGFLLQLQEQQTSHTALIRCEILQPLLREM